ncbi:AAA family ATPase [Cereibacter sphaeroides]|uniref:AAA family ATPase n=1 Tax=Cereibacter sphaeroides TaxID=1063 RepID=UPI001F40764A|nr:AAA family ATPase [Cereibacter sphaeroides]
MTKANELRYARVILVGDVKQLDPVSRGLALRAAPERAGMPTAIMADIQRQRNEDARKSRAPCHPRRGPCCLSRGSRIFARQRKNQSFNRRGCPGVARIAQLGARADRDCGF